MRLTRGFRIFLCCLVGISLVAVFLCQGQVWAKDKGLATSGLSALSRNKGTATPKIGMAKAGNAAVLKGNIKIKLSSTAKTSLGRAGIGKAVGAPAMKPIKGPKIGTIMKLNSVSASIKMPRR